MRLMRFLLAVALLAIGLFGAPWWADLAAEPASLSGSGAVVATTAPPAAPTASPAAPITATISAQESGSNEVWVDVDQSEQVVSIYEGRRAIKIMVASTGIASSPTPNGEFRVHHRGDWFYSNEFQQGAYYWVGLDEWGEYLFHSVPFTEERVLIEDEAALLGEPASHGCIRLSLDDAKWIYDYIPAGAKVVIHD